IKQRENDVALKYYQKAVQALDCLGWEDKQLALARGVLAGNGPPHKCAVFFVDNSGMDIILGVMPFVRELLCRGTEVVLASNSSPALNDVTNGELQILTERIAAMDPVIQAGLKNERLLLVQTGSSSPCLDLGALTFKPWGRRFEPLLRPLQNTSVLKVRPEKESRCPWSMGRAIHTNYYARLTCETLKMAVIKNTWLADRLGGKLFSVVFKYEVPPPPPPPTTTTTTTTALTEMMMTEEENVVFAH
ncbi:hypothetical protein CRUP_000834, partial [Coryphaenoides rupestris]